MSAEDVARAMASIIAKAEARRACVICGRWEPYPVLHGELVPRDDGFVHVGCLSDQLTP